MLHGENFQLFESAHAAVVMGLQKVKVNLSKLKRCLVKRTIPNKYLWKAAGLEMQTQIQKKKNINTHKKTSTNKNKWMHKK